MSIRTPTPAKAAPPPWRPVRAGVLQRKCACGAAPGPIGECAECRKKRLQPKLLVNQPGDRYEQEADRLADTVMRMAAEDAPATRRAGPRLQRKAQGHGSTAAPPIVEEVLRAPGQPLDAVMRLFMESRFGHDFSRVRVHTDARATASAQAVQARAYTVGRDVVFGARQYAPGTAEGRRLLAHELTHVVQQGRAAPVERALKKTPAPVEHRAGDGQAAPKRPSMVLRRAPQSVLYRTEDDAGSCTPSRTGFPPSLSNCLAYAANAWWLPLAYVNNATCACLTTPDSRTANCVRSFLQARMAGTPTLIKMAAAGQKPLEANPVTHSTYQTFVQTVLTPRIYKDHVDAYSHCCCPSGPAAYPAWIGVTTVPIQPCDLVGLTIRYFGSCHGTPGAW